MMDRVNVRVRILDAWDDIHLAVATDATVGELKRQVLDMIEESDAADEFVVKFRGVEMRDENRTLAVAGVPDDAALIVLRRRRRAVR